MRVHHELRDSGYNHDNIISSIWYNDSFGHRHSLVPDDANTIIGYQCYATCDRVALSVYCGITISPFFLVYATRRWYLMNYFPEHYWTSSVAECTSNSILGAYPLSTRSQLKIYRQQISHWNILGKI